VLEASQSSVAGALGDAVTIATRQRPECGHKLLVECPLNARDWEAVFFAYCGFMMTCRLISEAAHAPVEQ
jgi:hypothetical protein